MGGVSLLIEDLIYNGTFYLNLINSEKLKNCKDHIRENIHGAILIGK